MVSESTVAASLEGVVESEPVTGLMGHNLVNRVNLQLLSYSTDDLHTLPEVKCG
jgi:hypothetical protein